MAQDMSPQDTAAQDPAPQDPAAQDEEALLTPEQAKVLEALIECQKVRGGSAAPLGDVARTAGLPADTTRSVLAELITDWRLVQEIAGGDPGEEDGRYEIVDTD